MTIEDEIAAVPFWWHSIDINGVNTPGSKSAEALEAEWQELGIGDLSGRSVLDIGAWDGWFSFRAEREGAGHVVALDHPVWSTDLGRQQSYYKERRARGLPTETIPDCWRPDELPGKVGFDTARRLLDSNVEAVIGDFMTMDLVSLGTFDVVLFLGVLYHLRDPIRALERLASVTHGMALIETHAIAVAGHPDAAVWECYPGGELACDSSNWWGPTRQAVVALCRSVGFAGVEPLNDAPSVDQGIARYRAVFRAIR